MPWVRHDDGLRLIGSRHYEEEEIGQWIARLGESRNQPETVCRMLRELLSTRIASKELIWRLSKWCHWNHWSEEVAREITKELFHGIICRRLRDQQNRPIPNRAYAEADYQTWTERVIQRSQASAQDVVFPDEIDESACYPEGAARRSLVNSYERNREARSRCIEHYGTQCFICGFDFGKAYDGVGDGFIHVHHLRQLSSIGENYAVDPIADLRPICPNCHAIIHLYRQPFSIEKVQQMVAQARARHPQGPFA